MKKKATPKGKGRKKPKKVRRPKPASLSLAKMTNGQADDLTREEPAPDPAPAQPPLIAALKARKAAFVRAMTQSLGVASKASVMTGIPLRTHRQWMQDDEVYRALITELKEVALDFYEEALHELVKQRNPAAVIFALKTQGKRRGYIETVHNMNQAFDDNNVTIFEIPDNNRGTIEDAKVIP